MSFLLNQIEGNTFNVRVMMPNVLTFCTVQGIYQGIPTDMKLKFERHERY